MSSQVAINHSPKYPLNDVVESATQIILGKEPVIRLALSCLIARGHLLIEDLPGVGKTTLAHVLAKSLGLSYQRIQFTSDMLPADIIGASIFSRQDESFKFHAGPIFNQLILADEVNRATPRTQSSLLEAMEEYQVTIENETYELPAPFFVIATQNPSDQIGTFPLPESQLDRFLMRIELGYPNQQSERELLKGGDRRTLLHDLQASLTPEQLLEVQAACQDVFVSDALLDYLQTILEYTRNSDDFVHGLSPRAGLAVIRAAKAYSLLAGRQEVLPEDLQAILPAVVAHRLKGRTQETLSHQSVHSLLIEKVAIP